MFQMCKIHSFMEPRYPTKLLSFSFFFLRLALGLHQVHGADLRRLESKVPWTGCLGSAPVLGVPTAPPPPKRKQEDTTTATVAWFDPSKSEESACGFNSESPKISTDQVEKKESLEKGEITLLVAMNIKWEHEKGKAKRLGSIPCVS